MEYVDTDLAKLINTGQKLSSEHIKCIMLQLLAALKYMHSAAVLHRDLKPENVLVTESCEVKVTHTPRGPTTRNTRPLLRWGVSDSADMAGPAQLSSHRYGLCSQLLP